ncbi:acyl carrier protein [Sulfidibacter corallicola]|uniref:Acyl carrier protein n=1 Tax=Sulfidibacter corallicola TaxID=2818388 RepID=A0A8A4TH19_SULCO|nr:acyl carrier protein [Sulfidibacter corallicola]QTD48850.1 acyl carrier protein [Sulfidibacter corallicola]
MDRHTIFDMVVKNVAEVVPDLAGHDFQLTDSLVELGVDSVERSEIVIMTLENMNLNIPAVQVFGPKNLGELADLLHAKALAL